MNAEATPTQIFSLAARFATKLTSLGVKGCDVQDVIDNPNDSFWGDIDRRFKPVTPKPEVQKGIVSRTRIEILSEVPRPCIRRSDEDQICGQRKFYDNLGWDFTETGLVIPPRQPGFDRLLVMANPNLTNNGMFHVLSASFTCLRIVNDLDTRIPERNDERHPSRGPYAIWVRDCAEADIVHENKSANMIKEEGIKTLTLLERLYLEAVLYHETGQHLDREGSTLCSGSRSSIGGVPWVCWYKKLKVSCTRVDHMDFGFRARQAVILKT